MPNVADVLAPLLLYWRQRYGEQAAYHIGRTLMVPGWTGYTVAELQALGDKVAILMGLPRVDGG